MDSQSSDLATTPFSYDILDNEALKISSLILAVQQKSAQAGDKVAHELFAWAEACRNEGRRDEAEFLYLHCISICERKLGMTYPIEFKSLRDYAASLVARCEKPCESPVALGPALEAEFGAAA